jgi:membrane-associated PAP2 superfamily phosphatase
MSDAAPSSSGKTADPTAVLAPPPNVRRDWLVLGALILTTSALFAFTNLDITLASLFYHPGLDDPWPDQQQWLWRILNHYGPWPGGALALAGVGVLVACAVKPHWQRWRLHALAVILTVVIGPGLLVNVICKDHWGRPRPRDIIELGGTHTFRPPLLPDFGEAGKAFPCGHSSMGFVFFILFLIFRRSRPRLAWGILAGSVAWGLLIGVARMSAGGHFATDVLWSAWIPMMTALVVYHGILRIPRWEDRIAAGGTGDTARLNPWLMVAAVVIGAGMLVSLIAATPFSHPIHASAPTPTAGTYAVEIRGGPLTVVIDGDGDAGNHLAALDGIAQGFGFPGAGTVIGMTSGPAHDATFPFLVAIVFAHHGWFTELVATTHLHLPRANLAYITVQTADGPRNLIPPAAGTTLTITLDDKGLASPTAAQVLPGPNRQ